MIKRFLSLIIFVCLFLPIPAFAHSQVQVIEMTPDGFAPDPVTVDENSTVIFVNKDLKPRWPASNVHPTHELYPEFDPKKPIEPGQSWSFKPGKIGSHKYHDHLLPHKRGTLTVIGEEGSGSTKQAENKKPPFLEQIKQKLSSLFSQIKNFFSTVKPKTQLASPDEFLRLSPDQQNKALKSYVEDLDPQKVWQFIKEIFKGQAGSSGNIHDLAHLIGSLMYERGGFQNLGICSAEFAFGCYHGFLDRAFKDNLDHLTEALEACQKLGPETTGPVASCIHGIGHGVASYYSTKDLKKSLSTCRALIQGKEYCFDGVFMEFVRSAPESFFKREDPLYPCNELERESGFLYSFACGRNQPSLLMSRFNLGFSQVVQSCLSSFSKPFKEACFDSLGFSVAATGEVDQIMTACQSINEKEYIYRCIEAAAGELVFQEVPNWQEKAPQICNSLSESKDKCASHVNRLIKEYGKEVKKNFRQLKKGEDPNQYLRTQLKACFETGGKDGCYKEAATVLYRQFGLKDTLNLLRTNENYPEVYARCHEVTHYLSRFEYDKQKSIAKVYSSCDSTCHGGCYHGTLEAYLKEKQLEADSSLANHFPGVCGKPEDYQKPLEYNECLHGLGHAAMFVTDMELKDSLKLCDSLKNGEHESRCYTGVFMENSSSSTSFDHQAKFIKADDPFYPCNSLEEKYQPLCWQYQSSYFSIINNQDWGKVAQMCLQIPQQYQDLCFRTIGTNQVGFTQSLEVMRKNCELMPTDHFKSICVGGVISSLSYRFVGNAQKMIEFCSMVSGNLKETCYRQMGTSLKDWDKDKTLAQKECQKIKDAKWREMCSSVI